MTDHDPMTPSPEERALRALTPPPPSPAAQQAALQAALAAFAAQQAQNISQGSDAAPRPSHQATAIKPRPQRWERMMHRAKLLGGMALSFVLVGSVALLGYQTWHAPGSSMNARIAASPSSGYSGGGNGGFAAGAGAASGADLSEQITTMANQTSGSPFSGLKQLFADKEKEKADTAAQPPAKTMQMAAADSAVASNAVNGAAVNEIGQAASKPMPLPPGIAPESRKEVQAKDERNDLVQAEKKAGLVSSVEAAPSLAGKAVPAEQEVDGVRRHIIAEEPALRADVRQKAAVADKLAERVVATPTPAAPMPQSNAVLAPSMPTGGVAPMPQSNTVLADVLPMTPDLRKLLQSDDAAKRPGYQDFGRDKFEELKDNPVVQVAEAPVSTFSLDVDTSSYSFTRRSLNEGHLPPKDAIRVEEIVNYFDYNYALPETRETPFKPSVTVLPTPWNNKTMLLHIGIKGFDIQSDKRPAANLVFLIDTSGSMDEPTKLPLAKNALKMLVDTLRPGDHVAIVTYAGNAGTVLEPTAASEKQKILDAIDHLDAGGSTAGAEGIRQAYNLAQNHFDKNGVNRVILATDGDFNVGITDPAELQGYIEKERQSGVFLSVLGFGTGNYNDALMQKLAQNGNGTAAYIDNLSEARRVLVDEASRTLFPIAKDVKIQIEFNPLQVSEYRLIGYETRALQREDFNNDKVDAGDVGAGASVTAIYEITPKNGTKLVDDLRYGKPVIEDSKKTEDRKASGEYAYLKIRYKLPDGNTSRLISTPVTPKDLRGACPPDTKCEAVSPSDDVRFSVAAAAFGQILRGGKFTGSYSYDDVIALANGAKGKDEFGLRSEFVNLVRLAKNVPAMPKQP